MPVKLSDKNVNTVTLKAKSKYTVTITDRVVTTVVLKDIKVPKH